MIGLISDSLRRRLQWYISQESFCLTGFRLKIISNEVEISTTELRENDRQFQLSAGDTANDDLEGDEPNKVKVQIQALSEIGAGSTKTIQFVLNPEG